jgi:hypothetical protein
MKFSGSPDTHAEYGYGGDRLDSFCFLAWCVHRACLNSRLPSASRHKRVVFRFRFGADPRSVSIFADANVAELHLIVEMLSAYALALTKLTNG